MSLTNLLEQVADAYRLSGHERADELADEVLACLDAPVNEEPSSAIALEEMAAAAAAPDAHPLAQTIGAVSAQLNWRTASAMQQLDVTRDRHAFVELGGPGGMFSSQTIRFGLYFQSSETVYPIHFHAAEEFYFLLSGTADWKKGDEPYTPRTPGTLIQHLSMQPHATNTHAEPLLALWLWTGDIATDSYKVLDIGGL